MDILRLLNILFSVYSLPPALILLAKMFKQEKNGTNIGLRLMFGGLSVIAVLNAGISLFSIFGFGNVSHVLSLVTRVFASGIILVVVWIWYFISRE